MKHIRVALALCTLPATALAQGVVCQTCDHVAPWFRGEGGFIATVAEDVDEVVFVASCGNVTTTGEIEPGAGLVAQLFTYRNGLACDRDDGSLEISGLEEGGWYWITDETNSAVGSLIGKDVLGNEPTAITSAGAGVSMTVGKGAVYLKETATGRVGILPNILPEPPADPVAVCGPRIGPDDRTYTTQASSNCMLGGGRTKIRLVGPGSFGSQAAITNGMVYRPEAGTVTVTADLWVDESGSYATGATPDAAAIQKGWIGKAAPATNWLTATFSASVEATVGTPTDVPADDPDTADEVENVAGVSVINDGTDSEPAGQATFRILPDGNYCSQNANHTAVVNISAEVAEGGNAIHPSVATGRAAGFTAAADAMVAQRTQLRVVCPPR